MNTPPKNTSERTAAGKRLRLPALTALGAGVLIATMTFLYYRLPSPLGKEQPIPFSHRVHAGDKQISCLFCHSEAPDGNRAGIPPLQTCMLCHSKIIVDYPNIVDLRTHYAAGVPIAWERVNDVPDFVYFDHSVHIHRGIDCGVCHGDVRAMDRVTAAHDLNMGFCVQCHRDHHASHDCTVCHR